MSHAKIKLVTKKLSSLIPYSANPRQLEDPTRLKASIVEYGYLDPIIVDSNNVVIAGHQRLKVLTEQKIKEIDVVVADELTEGQTKSFRIIHNRTSEDAEWDKELFQAEMIDVLDKAGAFFDEKELQALLGEDLSKIESPEFDESAADNVEMIKCPNCDHEFPK